MTSACSCFMRCTAGATRHWWRRPSRCTCTSTRHAGKASRHGRGGARELRRDPRIAGELAPPAQWARARRAAPELTGPDSCPRSSTTSSAATRSRWSPAGWWREYGFDQATIVRIAREAGYTTGMVAHYFDTKQDIIIAALRLILRRIEERLTAECRGRCRICWRCSTEALPVDEHALHRVRVLDRLLGPGVRGQAAEAHQRLGASRVHAPVRALSRARLAGLGATGRRRCASRCCARS